MKAHSKQRMDLTKDVFLGEYKKRKCYEGVEMVDYLDALGKRMLLSGRSSRR